MCLSTYNPTYATVEETKRYNLHRESEKKAIIYVEKVQRTPWKL